MATSRIRTLTFLPEIFQTPTNAQFLGATLDKIVDQPNLEKIQGYVGSRFGYGINAEDYYVTEPTKTRRDYQLDPGVVFTKPNQVTAQDFISYPGILDALKLEGALTGNNDRLFSSQFYSWDSFCALDKIINFHQYYWIPEGPAPVAVSVDTVYSINDYLVTDVVNGYKISELESTAGAVNPTITLLRGGSYTFTVNQASQFWIQGAPGTTGYSPTQPNMQTRDILGVANNGSSLGVVYFDVPTKDAQDQYNFPGNNLVSVVSTLPYDSINGAVLSDLNNIDGITSLEGLTVMFYNTGIPNELGYVSNFYDYTPYDQNDTLVAALTITATATTTATNRITCNSTAALVENNTITFTGLPFGGLLQYSTVDANTLYYIKDIVSSTQFTVALSVDGAEVALSTASGTLTGNINQGLLEEGYYTNVNETFYTITYVGDASDPVIRLVPNSAIPTEQKITATFGTEWNSRNFYKDISGPITIIPFLSAPLDTLYYQDGTSSNKVGIFRIVDSNTTNEIDVDTDIIGQTTYTAPNGVVFTNGLKVTFQGDISPTKYQTGQYYVEGVGTAIELILESDMIVPESFTSSTYVPWDTTAWDIGNWEGNAYIPVTPDYITIARNSIDRNPWSRGNRWFHIDVINATADYNNAPDLVTLYTQPSNKSRRPIIEFYPNLKLFNTGTYGKQPVDFIDQRTTDAFELVAGQQNYYPDVEVYTDYSATITGTDYTSGRTATQTTAGTTVPLVGGLVTCNDTTGFRVNDIVNLTTTNIGGLITGTNYYVAEVVSSTQFRVSATKNGDQLVLTTQGPISAPFQWSPRSTTIIVVKNNVTGVFSAGQYVADSTNKIPKGAVIDSISGTSTLTLTISWTGSSGSYISSTAVASVISTPTSVDGFNLFDGATVIFAADTDSDVRNKIYVSRLSVLHGSTTPVITLTKIEDGDVLPNDQSVILRGYANQGVDYYFDGADWIKNQQKITVNQPPLFDLFDANGVSLGDPDVYTSSSFNGNKLFAYGIGTGLDDPVLLFPLKYNSVDNVGDISFDVSLNLDTFNYVSGTTPITEKTNTGFVYDYSTRTEFTRKLGWETAVSPSAQYQIFEFDYYVSTPATTYICDVAPAPADSTMWPIVSVYFNNETQARDTYTVTAGDTTTTVELATQPTIDTVIQITVISDQVSKTAYYGIPWNLNNNPLNADITTANVGDIRGHYQSIFYNCPDTTGLVFGANNYHDLGNLVRYGNSIIQNSASLALPAAFLRKQDHNLFNSLLFNGREYVKFKTLLVDTVNNSDYEQRYDASFMLDDALDQITASKSKSQPFFWSDMVPAKAPYASNTYSFANNLDVSIYPLTKVYDYNEANYNGVLVYLTRTTNNIRTVRQLVKGQDYTISSTAPSLTVTLDLLPGDQITVKEFNQTYGSYVPNTPTKLGLYPASLPEVILDSQYTQPTYFIRGHDGSYNKLYGSYDPATNILVDFRDQVLLEFELRVYNNLKLNAVIPVQEYEVLPGFFRETDYTYEEWLTIYSYSFLDWIGQNRIDYKRQLYNASNQFTFNYWQSANKINKQPITQGYWRGVYQYFYDTTTPNVTPWEMLGFTDQPSWWENRYGPAPYTSDNLILWDDLAAGLDWNSGDPIVIPNAVRSGLTSVIPVDSNGTLLSPFDSIVGNYNSFIFQRDWKIGDIGPAELSYRRSSSYPFDLMRILALTKPAKFFNLAVDMDNYKYSEEFDQYLVNGRSHLNISNLEIYGSGTAKTSYINWIVDYEKQLGIDATNNITVLLANIDVRLVYRMAGFSDKTMLKFYVEKGSPNSSNASLLIPDENYAVLLYDNQPFNRIMYSGIVVQIVNNGFSVYGNSQTSAYFKTLQQLGNGNTDKITVEKLSVKVANDYSTNEVLVPYSTTYYSVQEVSQFVAGYGAYLESQGMIFDSIEFGLEINWKQMVAEFLYWAQTGWQEGSIVTLNPSATLLKIDKDNNIVQPLTLRQTNFVLNQNLYPIQSMDMSIIRDGTLFSAQALNQGDSISYGQFNIGNVEHAIVFDNVTQFNDILYNLTTGLRQSRITVKGAKTAEWNGTLNASGFIYNQDNVPEWNNSTKYTQGSIVKYKNKFWTALKIIQISSTFTDLDWKYTSYEEIQKGLLPNTSTRSFESTLYYDINQSNLELDADLLSFSLIGYRPRDYLALADLTDITQINVYKNLIKEKGTLNAANAFKGASLAQGGIKYDIYENWAIKSGEFGGVLNGNFVEFKINEKYMTGNPSIVGLTNGIYNTGVQQEVPIYSLFNYGRPITNVDILSQVPSTKPSMLLADAGYVNYNDVKMSSYFYSQLPTATNSNGTIIPIQEFYVRDYVWLANYLEKWQVFSPESIGGINNVKNNLNNTSTVTFSTPHNLSQYSPFAIVSFNPAVDGYYVASIIVDQYRVIINLPLDINTREITGNGVGLYFQSQRVSNAADIATLPLLNAEFRKNTVWVDTNVDGSWAVFRKNLNYQFTTELLTDSGQTFGSAVACGSQLGYLIGDATAGTVTRYQYDDVSSSYVAGQVITNGSSFGTTITRSDDIIAISEPTGAMILRIYQLQNSTLSDDISLYQTISSPGGVTTWGSAVALSGDKKWLYVSDIDNNSVYIYNQLRTPASAGSFTVGQTYIITDAGTTDFTTVGATSNEVGTAFIATGAGTGTGTAFNSTYTYSTIIDADVLSLTVAGDNFGTSIATDYYGDTVIISAPNKDYNATIDNWGYSYVFDRSVQNTEAQYNSEAGQPQITLLAWTPTTQSTTVTATNAGTGKVTLVSMTNVNVNDPVIFSGSGFLETNIITNIVYYVMSISGSDIVLKTSRSSTTPVTLLTKGGISSANASFQYVPMTVSVNGTVVDDNNYAVIGSSLYYVGALSAGDVTTISGNTFTLVQTLTTENTPRVGVHFGTSVDTTIHASEILVGAPFELNSANEEGAVYRYTNGGGKYGTVTGVATCTVTAARYLLINGYLVTIPAGDATSTVAAIISANITNVTATVLAGGVLAIQLVDSSLAPINEKLLVSATDSVTLSELGLLPYVQTQTINCPHRTGATQFGTVVKFNELDSFVASAPAGTKFAATTFDFIDDENQNDDTIFDNNATTWIDTYKNSGAAYMFEYLPVYNESLVNTGKFTYAQSVNNQNELFGSQPYYGTALDFNDNTILIGTQGFMPLVNNGQVIAYTNSTGIQDWSVYRSSSPVVDIDRVYNIQLFSAETNNTLINLDYLDPLQGKLLGAVRENIDVISNIDPAKYNNGASVNGKIWGADYVGQIWFNTKNVKFVNYHQNDITYNSKHWGEVFDGSDVAVYTWIASNVVPAVYQDQGTPYSIGSYSIQYVINPSGALTPVYYYWVENTNIVFSQAGKTLADSTVASYIRSPNNSGISYFAPLLPSVFGLYNSGEYINENDSVLHIGYATGTNDDPTHNQYSLIRENYPDDFLPGFPRLSTGIPEALYNRLLDSMCGVDEAGAVVPNPYLPKAVQYGILSRPSQSFFVNRFTALKNYLQYANVVIAQFPITETRQASFLNSSGEFYDTADYWEYIDWWAPGYGDSTKSEMQIPLFSDLLTLSVPQGTIATVVTNGNGLSEVYRLDTTGTWVRIGLTNGTIQFKSSLWDYQTSRLGFGDNFFDTTAFDQYPSDETRKIVRALNEQIYINDLLIFRNKSLILLFEYIQSETLETQNYLPWLNKTSFIDVSHTIRELRPVQVFQSDNQAFLEGYLNEVKPYHVVIKEFLFKYTGSELYAGVISDFDLPAKYDSAVEKFESPQLVYSNPNGINQYLPGDPIWDDPEYSSWYENYGLSLTGQDNVLISTLASYIALNSSEFAVDNAQGFPINGIIKLGTEQIGYAVVDRNLNVLSGLTRGVNGTAIVAHIPGDLIYMDLPAILLLDGGRGYIDPPRVTAYIDTTIYPAPSREAVLTPVMSGDSVLQVTVVDPGDGYAVLPKIVIEPAVIVTFSSASVNTLSNTIQLFAPELTTGDLIQYHAPTDGTSVGGLDDGQWYYVNLLETSPSVLVALYDNYTDAIRNEDKITLYTTGTGTDNKLNVGAKASAISSALPIREKNITLRFDRTTYTSRLIDWIEGIYYGAFFAGDYLNSNAVASSSITLENVLPPISQILASAQGTGFEITEVENDRVLTYSSFLRTVESTNSADNSIKLTLLDDGSGNPNASGSTLGFYVGMPVLFRGAVCGGIVEETEYYVHSIIDETDFTISLIEGGDPSGSPVTLTSATVSAAGLTCNVGEVVDTAIITVNYPGITTVTATTAGSNILTIPLNSTGSGGTIGFYTNLPVFFTGTMLGGLVENQVYYVTTALTIQTFTISETQNPETYSITLTTASTDAVNITQNTNTLSINEPIVFNEMVIDGVAVADFGNIIAGTIYYVATIIDSNNIQISTEVNGSIFALANTTGTTHTAQMISQINTVKLITAAGNDMTININLPVSPGQVNGQQFTLYQTSDQYPDLTGTNNDLISRSISAIVGGPQLIVLSADSGGLSNIYVNMPFRVSQNIGLLATGTTYYVSDTGSISVLATSSNSASDALTCTSTTSLYIDMPVTFTGVGLGGLVIGTTYYVRDILNSTEFTVTNTPGGAVTALTTTTGLMTINGPDYIKVLTVDPGTSQYVATINISSPADAVIDVSPEVSPANLTTIKFSTSGALPTGITENITYYVRNRTATTFNISETPTGALKITSGAQSGIQTVIENGDITADQYIVTDAIFDASYIVGGYRTIITEPGAGYAVNNTILIPGTDMGGSSPLNDLTLTISEVDENGAITHAISSGTVPGLQQEYYLKVISPNKFKVYENAQFTIPVSGIGFPYYGEISSAVTSVNASTNKLTIADTSLFDAYDPVVFTGDIADDLNITLGQTYYIYDITSSTEFRISTLPGDVTTVVDIGPGTGSVDFTMATQGDIALLPEPVTFNQSIVKYNNKVYVCIVSNNDSKFIFGKWELVQPSDRRLNALDRIKGYYQPSDNMPGIDITQLVANVIYPNSTYLGNAFAPEDQYPIDTTLIDLPFYPAEVDVRGLVWDGTTYFGPANTPTESKIATSTDGTNWQLLPLSNTAVGTTDIEYVNGVYLITTNVAAAPIYKSLDGVIWTAQSNLAGLLLSLNSITYGDDDSYVAVGNAIITSTDDTETWTQSYTLPTDPRLTNTLNGVKYVNIPSFPGYIAVGKGQTFDYSTGLTEVIDINLVLYKSNTGPWNPATYVSTHGFNAVDDNGTVMVAIGDAGVIYVSDNGSTWLGINETTILSVNGPNDTLNVTSTIGLSANDPVRFTTAFSTIAINTTYYVNSIVTPTQLKISATNGGAVKTLSDVNPSSTTYMYTYPAGEDLTDLLYANSIFMAVGDAGTVRTSVNGYTWVTQTTGSTADLFGIAYNTTSNTWLVSGVNTVLSSPDDGTTWTNSLVFDPDPITYTVQGAEFEYGYGPEELVPGVVMDNLSLTVSTRPGTNWDVTEYQHVGYNVVSVEYPIGPTASGPDLTFSFANAVATPAQVAVFLIDTTTGIGYEIFSPDYSVDWIDFSITLASAYANKLVAIDVYEVGNGNQLVKSNTKNDPIEINTSTGWDEIELNCNYTGTYNGTGVIRPGTGTIVVVATDTEITTNTIQCASVTDFILNGPITFQGTTFGNIVAGTTYYVKEIGSVSNKITISDSLNSGGLAGPTFVLVTASGTMNAIIGSGAAAVWTPPIVYHNGTKLILGGTGLVSSTTTGTNVITCNTTAPMVGTNTPILFSASIFGGLVANTTYYVKTIVNSTSFTVSATPGGAAFALTTAAGGASYITNDYAIGIAADGIAAKMILSTGSYDNTIDYLAYTFFGISYPIQYGYTIPETQLFIGDGVTDEFDLLNYAGGYNPTNAIVEVDGIRKISTTDYTIDSTLNTVTFTSAPALNAVISVTTYNLTDRQYFTTQEITGKTVANIIAISNTIANPILSTTVSTDAGTDVIVLTSTSGMIVGQTIQFKGTGFGGVAVDGTVYFIKTIPVSGSITISSTLGGGTFNITATGAWTTAVANVGGQPAVRVTTGINHELSENDLVRIDGTTGSTTLNNNTYYAKIISPTEIDLYTQSYNPALAAINYPVTDILTYTGGGYVWLDATYILQTTTATATATDTVTGNRVTVGSTADFALNTPILFTQTGIAIGSAMMGGIIAGTTYFIREIFNSTQISITETYEGSEYVLTNDAESAVATQWEQINVDRLWVTINGYRVASSSLRINPANDISILSPIISTDTVMITSMIPSETPNTETFMIFINRNQDAEVYRTNAQSSTWLTNTLYNTEDTIYVDDVSTLTNSIIQTENTPVAVSGLYDIGLTVDKRLITGITVYNNTTSATISSVNYAVVIKALSPILEITAGAWITSGDSLTITTVVGNTVFINGEEIRFTSADLTTNTLSGLQRGANGTGEQTEISIYTQVYGLLPENAMPDDYYYQTWNSYDYNTTLGDPLQISNTAPAAFLRAVNN